MEQQLQELHELKRYLGIKLAQHLAAGGRTDDPFVRSIWELHGELSAVLEEGGVSLADDGDEGAGAGQECERSTSEPPDDLTNFGYLRWLLEREQVS